MTIRQYLTTEFAVISLNCDIDQVKAALISDECLVVLNEHNVRIGLLTCADLVGEAIIAADCPYIKSLVSPDESLLEVTSLMKQTGHTILPVGEHNQIIGVIKSNNILYPLAETVRKYQLLFQHVTHDLRNPIGNITGIFSMFEESLVKSDNIELLQYGQAASAAALEMLSELLKIEKKDNDRFGFRITNVADFVIKTIEQLKGIFIPKEIQLKALLYHPGCAT